jgi:hypothetical protein
MCPDELFQTLSTYQRDIRRKNQDIAREPLQLWCCLPHSVSGAELFSLPDALHCGEVLPKVFNHLFSPEANHDEHPLERQVQQLREDIVKQWSPI